MSAVTPLDLTSRRVLLTGAGSGIGRRLALELAIRGGQLVLVGRHEQPLAWGVNSDVTCSPIPTSPRVGNSCCCS